jgi:ribosome-associated protein
MTEPNHSLALAHRAVDLALAKKGEDLVVLDLRGVLDVTDFFVVATGFSEIQIRAIADAIVDGAREDGEKALHVEGRDLGRWILIDFVDVVVHVMLPEEREKYKLDRLWGDAAMTRFDDQTGAVVEERAAAHPPPGDGAQRAQEGAGEDGVTR